MTKPLRIVIADDESDIRNYFRRLLPRFGHVVVGEAETGRKLVELCQSELPDLVITDIGMPEMDGIEAANEITKTRSIPIIIVSSHEPKEFDIGATIVAYLVKPIVMPELQAAIGLAGVGTDG